MADINFKFNNEQKVIYTDDPLYDLFDGGYIHPEHMLTDLEQVKMVQAAVEIVREFLDAAFKEGYLDDC